MNIEYKLRRPLSKSQEELREKMINEVGSRRYGAVSFKLKDVLVMLPFSGEADIFALMEDCFTELCGKSSKTFTEMRLAAGEAALKKMNVGCRVTLKLIYSILEKNEKLSAEASQKLMERECEIIERYAFPRECGKLLYRKAKDCNKRVVITADTIYPETTVKRVLGECGYGAYDELVVTAKIKNCTGESYFPEVLAKAGVGAEKLLHIGGDVAFDIELPICKGAKALMLAPAAELMARSGRVRGYAEDKKFFEYEEPRYFALRAAFGLYSAYAFDTPQNKLPMSDFCGDEYSMGFLVLGTLGLMKDFEPKNKEQKSLISAMEENPKMAEGKKDFEDMFFAHFGDMRLESKAEGCRLPLEFIENCCAASDRAFIDESLGDSFAKKWAKSVKEPEVIRYSPRKLRKNPLSRLADKMFPPGSRVRTIVDSILAKGHK